MLSLCPKCDMSLDPIEISTPVEARHLLTSVAQVVYPALYLSMSRPGFTVGLISVLKNCEIEFQTVIDKMNEVRL